MKKLPLALTILFALSLLFSVPIVYTAHPLLDLQTPAEISNWTRTTSSQEVQDYCRLVADNSGGRINMVNIGTSVQGRPISMLVIGQQAPRTASEVPESKAIVLVNCNIHSGEIEGKEAMLIFVREVAMGKHDDLLKDLVVLLIPNMNPDGNDDLGKHRITTQFTPKQVGTRYDGENYNINRDMTKLDSQSAVAVVNVMNEWDPVLFIDAHATDGSFMQHAVTYNWGLHANTDPELLAYNRDVFCELALGEPSYLRSKGKIAIPYGNFGLNYSGVVSQGWRTFEDYARYTTNYAGLRNRLALLLEVYSYDEFSVRVDTQYECIYGALQAVRQEKTAIKELIARVDRRSFDRAADGINPERDYVALNSSMEILTESNGGKVDVLSYALDATGRVSGERILDEEGDPCGVKLGEKTTYTLDYWGKFVPTKSEVMGAYYLIEADGTAGVELLRRHGIEIHRLEEDVTLTPDQFQWYDVSAVGKAARAYEGHLMNAMNGAWKRPEAAQVIPAGTYVVSTAQVRGSLASLLLEPASVDGAVSWNVFDSVLSPVPGSIREGYVSHPADSAAPIALPIFKVDSFDAIDISIPLTSLTLIAPRLSLKRGQTLDLAEGLVKKPLNANERVLWTSGNASMAEVGEDGVVYAKKAGVVVITAASESGAHKTVGILTILP